MSGILKKKTGGEPSAGVTQPFQLQLGQAHSTPVDGWMFSVVKMKQRSAVFMYHVLVELKSFDPAGLQDNILNTNEISSIKPKSSPKVKMLLRTISTGLAG